MSAIQRVSASSNELQFTRSPQPLQVPVKIERINSDDDEDNEPPSNLENDVKMVQNAVDFEPGQMLKVELTIEEEPPALKMEPQGCSENFVNDDGMDPVN
ncbi:hypothetical protein O0L34_g11967 [Tuta absoluta]|nr:hypothetical protein O0L34_g11967 [Tuta absoluta]